MTPVASPVRFTCIGLPQHLTENQKSKGAFCTVAFKYYCMFSYFCQQRVEKSVKIYDPHMIMSSYTTNDYVPTIV